ncbi:MAG: nucleotide pyrophosphohydrolase [Candidatus Saccharimonadales bacterium]
MSKRDDQTTIQELKDLVTQFSEERGWDRHHTPKNLAVSIAIEAAELMEHFQWDEYQQNDRDEIAAELADILAYIFNFAAVMDIDIATTYREKLKKAVQKYPVKLFNKDRVGEADFFRIKQAHRQKKEDKK